MPNGDISAIKTNARRAIPGQIADAFHSIERQGVSQPAGHAVMSCYQSAELELVQDDFTPVPRPAPAGRESYCRARLVNERTNERTMQQGAGSCSTR